MPKLDEVSDQIRDVRRYLTEPPEEHPMDSVSMDLATSTKAFSIGKVTEQLREIAALTAKAADFVESGHHHAAYSILFALSSFFAKMDAVGTELEEELERLKDQPLD